MMTKKLEQIQQGLLTGNTMRGGTMVDTKFKSMLSKAKAGGVRNSTTLSDTDANSADENDKSKKKEGIPEQKVKKPEDNTHFIT